MLKTYKSTIHACYFGYITQAMGINFIPLVYLYFAKNYGLTWGQIALIPTLMFVIQMGVDLLSAFIVKKLGYRFCASSAHFLAAFGMLALCFMPDWFYDPYIGVLIAVVMFSIGCGLIEVIISPLVQACPSDQKTSSMGFLHSFYSWGQAGVVLISTLLFKVLGMDCWRWVAAGWGLIPFFNGIAFLKVPITTLEDAGKDMPIRLLARNKSFWIAIVMMICAGASELAVAQWASAFAESGLGVSKSVGDIMGPCMFAILMGISRIIYSFTTNPRSLKNYMIFSAALCTVSYILITLQPNPIIALIGCAFVGFAVGVMWPGTYSLTAQSCPQGGTTMFAFLALAGDIGCTSGATLAGVMSDVFGGDIRWGILCAIIFPIVMLICSKLVNSK